GVAGSAQPDGGAAAVADVHRPAAIVGRRRCVGVAARSVPGRGADGADELSDAVGDPGAGLLQLRPGVGWSYRGGPGDAARPADLGARTVVEPDLAELVRVGPGGVGVAQPPSKRMRDETMGRREVLFLCTGNYYRSRFADILFSAEASRRGLAWSSFSRG